MIKTLRTLPKFILEVDKYRVRIHSCHEILNFTKFLELEPLIWMFIPCDLKGNILDEPIDLGILARGQPFHDVYLNSLAEYNEAKNRCYFEDFNIEYPEDHKISSLNGTLFLTSEEDKNILEEPIAFRKDWEDEWVFNYQKLGDLVEAPLKLSKTGQIYIHEYKING